MKESSIFEREREREREREMSFKTIRLVNVTCMLISMQYARLSNSIHGRNYMSHNRNNPFICVTHTQLVNFFNLHVILFKSFSQVILLIYIYIYFLEFE
jgi:hypothetical protein